MGWEPQPCRPPASIPRAGVPQPTRMTRPRTHRLLELLHAPGRVEVLCRHVSRLHLLPGSGAGAAPVARACATSSKAHATQGRSKPSQTRPEARRFNPNPAHLHQVVQHQRRPEAREDRQLVGRDFGRGHVRELDQGAPAPRGGRGRAAGRRVRPDARGRHAWARQPRPGPSGASQPCARLGAGRPAHSLMPMRSIARRSGVPGPNCDW
jgi:hypothetical protein